MRRNGLHKTLSALAFVLLPAAVQSQGISGNEGTSGEELTASSDAVVVTVDGHPITRAEIEKLFVAMARDRHYGKRLTDAELEPMRRAYWPRVVLTAVDMWLVNHEIPDTVPAFSDSEMIAVLDMELAFTIANLGSTREEFDASFKDNPGVTLYELLSWQRSNLLSKDGLRRERWIATKYPDAVKVTEEEINDVYKRKWTDRTLPAQVRVSHILIAADSDSDEGKALARKKIERVLAEARKPGADFAALARKHSTCASASKGGDLGFIHRYGDAFDAFAEAAFALKIGEISDVVDAPDGYHIIKLTGRIAPRAATLPLVDDVIRTGLRKRKIQRVTRDYIEKLRSSATIVYADTPPAK